MRFLLACVPAVAWFSIAGCGDNSKECGEGTNDDDGDGLCEAVVGGGSICGDGTRLDELTGTCVVDPAVCGDGTVLINGECRDPSTDLEVDVEEGPEPNGFETGATPAGMITVPTIGTAFVIHGCVRPLDNNSPDFDRYELTVAGPTLLDISIDGVQGLAGGFEMRGDPQVALLATWRRLGINVATDASRRQVLLPAAGDYELVITDTRTLLPITQNGEGAPAAGNLDGTSCYYASIAQLSLPAPTPIDVVNGHTGTTAGELVFFTGPFPGGSTTLRAVIDPEDIDNNGTPDIDSRAASALVLLVNTALVARDDADATSPISQLVVSGVQASDDVLLVLDHVWNLTLQPAAYELERL